MNQTAADFEESARRGVVPADRGMAPDQLVRLIVAGRKPVAVFELRRGHADAVRAVREAEAARLMVVATRPRDEGGVIVQDVVVASTPAHMHAYIQAFCLPWGIDRSIAIGHALGYSNDDINAFVKQKVGRLPTARDRLALEDVGARRYSAALRENPELAQPYRYNVDARALAAAPRRALA